VGVVDGEVPPGAAAGEDGGGDDDGCGGGVGVEVVAGVELVGVGPAVGGVVPERVVLGGVQDRPDTEDELLDLALEHDPGFDQSWFAGALAAIHRLPDSLFEVSRSGGRRRWSWR
jgi:hypothetical protein